MPFVFPLHETWWPDLDSLGVIETYSFRYNNMMRSVQHALWTHTHTSTVFYPLNSELLGTTILSKRSSSLPHVGWHRKIQPMN